MQEVEDFSQGIYFAQDEDYHWSPYKIDIFLTQALRLTDIGLLE